MGTFSKQNITSAIFALGFLSVLSLSPALPCLGQEGRTVERTYISTDRVCYAAGERVFCSAFCLTPEGKHSSFSSIAYLELFSSDGHGTNGKIALREGRGAGYLDLPGDLPTGNYRLIAYTAVNKNEDGYDYSAFSKTISVYNTSSANRVQGGVKIAKADDNIPSADKGNEGNLTVEFAKTSDGRIGLQLENAVDAELSVSVFHDEGLPVYDSGTLGSFLSSIRRPETFSDKAIPEFDGEIIRVKIEPSEGSLSEIRENDIFIATPGSTSDTYSARVGDDGIATFFTSNIFGEKDMAIEIKDYNKPFSFSILSPFEGKGKKDDIPALLLSNDMEQSITRMGEAMQVTAMFDADTLYGYLPTRALPFTGKDRISYVLDDYTRFSTMREIFIEYLFDIRVRRDREKGVEMKVSCNDRVHMNSYIPDGESLILIDGVPVFDHDLIYEYDPSLVKRIDVYPYIYFIGGHSYEGIANFVTYEGNMPSFSFGPEVKIADFHGASLPLAITGDFPTEYPLLRETIYWNPLLYIKGGERKALSLSLPEYEGTFRIVVEGIDSDGKPVYHSESFTLD